MKGLKNTNTVKQIIGLLHLPPLSLPRLTRQSLTALLAAFALLLASCSNGISGTEADSNSADGKTYISISAKTSASRSIAPSADDYSTEKLTDLVLSGKTVGEGAESDTEAVPLAQAESLGELSGKSIPIEAGNWLFTLSASLNGVTFYGETRAEIEKGKINPISFTLTPATIYGGMSITVEFTGEADKVSVSLKKAGNEELLAGSVLTPVQGSVGKKSVTFSRSASAEAERLESGSYYLLFEFFGLEGIERLNTVENIVRVQEGITTTAKLTLDLNEIYTITYQTNGGEIASTDDILTSKYSRKSEEITLPEMKKSGYIFKGWYENSDTDYANPLEYIDSSRASNLTLVAYFEEIPSTFYVTARTLADGESDTGDGSQEKPFANIQNAIEKIKSYNAADVDYTITVSGMDDSTQKVSGNKAGLLIADTSEYDANADEFITVRFPANSITIQGDGTGDADGIAGTEYEYVPVVINTTVHITFKNFLIKPQGYVTRNEKDGFALVIGPGANVTLSEGFEVDGSDTTWEYSSFGAVYVSEDSTLIMEKNSSVHNLKMKGPDSNTMDYGGGIFVDGTLEMKDSSSVYSVYATGNKGGGIYITSNGKVTLKDSALVGSIDSGNGNSCKVNGGGVYLAGGEFIMEGGTITGNVLGANSNNHGSGVFVESGTFKMSGSAVVAEDNDVYLASGAKVTIAGSLTGTSPVATITPGEYTAGTTLLEVSSDSGTTLAAEYEKFAVTQDSSNPDTPWWINTEGKLKDKYGDKDSSEGYAVGDIVFNDGSATPYATDLTLTDKQKAAAIALIFYKGTDLNSGDNTATNRTLGVGLKHNKSLVSWCRSSAEARSTNITTIQCPPSGPDRQYTFEGDKNGSDNLEQIAAFLGENNDTGVGENSTKTKEEAATLYPAFYFAKNYKDVSGSNVSGTAYEEGWYLPSIAELFQVYVNGRGSSKVFAIDEASQALGGDTFGSSYYWSSSQSNEGDGSAYDLFLDSGRYTGNGCYKSIDKYNGSMPVCCIREF